MVEQAHGRHPFILPIAMSLLVTAVLSQRSYAQTPSTGALAGVTLDSSGAVVSGTDLSLMNQRTGNTASTTSDEQGRFGFLLVTPGTYKVCASQSGFAQQCSSGINIAVTETRHL